MYPIPRAHAIRFYPHKAMIYTWTPSLCVIVNMSRSVRLARHLATPTKKSHGLFNSNDLACPPRAMQHLRCHFKD